MRTYWLDLFTAKTWDEFLKAGGTISGFRESRWKVLQQVQPGDYLLCYLTGLSRFIGVLEVTSKAYRDASRIWEDEEFPCRVHVRTITALSPEIAVPIFELKDKLTLFEAGKGPNHWLGYVRGSPSKWNAADGAAIVEAVTKAKEHPIIREVDKTKLGYRPRALLSKVGGVTVPGGEPSEPPKSVGAQATVASDHTHIQWLLARLGNDMGLDVWVAKNDRGRQVGEEKFTDLQRLKSELPPQFDEATNRTIELIDVLWLKKHSIVAAFEIEATTSIYSGLLRLSDLISMQPNLNIPLFIVAPDERRDKVIDEVNRPTFSKLNPPMYQMCRLIAFSTLKDKLAQIGPYVRYLKPDFLDELAESCEIEEA